MVEVLPFRGLRYRDDLARAAVFSPPYDVINELQRRYYMRRSPYNVVKLTLGPAKVRNWHEDAAATMRQWVEDDILIRDTTPAFYGYQQHFVLPGGSTRVRTGFLNRVGLREWGQGIHRHEHTCAGPRADRLRLMRATRANMSPMFGLYRDPGAELSRWLRPPSNPPVDFVDEEGVRQIFWTIHQTETIKALVLGLADRDIVIADGHHRYETALAYRAERRRVGGDPAGPRAYDYVMMYLTALEDPELVILPSHRLVWEQQRIDGHRLLAALSADFDIEPLDGQTNLTKAIAPEGSGPDTASTITFGAYLGKDGSWILRLKDLDRARHAGRGQDTPALNELDVMVLQNLILQPHLGISPDLLVHTDYVSYTIDEREARELVREGGAQAAFILNPTRLDQVWEAAQQGATMPQKSTYFYPKPLTGLVFNPLDDLDRRGPD